MKSLEDMIDDAAADYAEVEKILGELREATLTHIDAAQALMNAERKAIETLEHMPDKYGFIGDMVSGMQEVESHYEAGAMYAMAMNELPSFERIEEMVHDEYREEIEQRKIEAAEFRLEERMGH